MSIYVLLVYRGINQKDICVIIELAEKDSTSLEAFFPDSILQ